MRTYHFGMSSRSLLAASCGALLLLAGCGQMSVASDGPPSTADTSTSTSTTEETTTEPTTEPEPSPSEEELPPPPEEAPPGEPAPGEPAPPPPPDVDPQRIGDFTGMLDQFGANMPEGTDPVVVAQEACGMLDENRPVVEVNDFVAERGQYDANKGALFLGAGVPLFCPGNTDKLLG